MIWSTDGASFGLISRRSLESIFFHHPHASVHVFSNTLPAGFFGDFTSAGFVIHLERYNLTQLLQDTPAAAWLTQLARWREGPYFYSHVTDVMRLALIYREGGVYMDMDMLLVRPLRLALVPSTLTHPPPTGAASEVLGNAIGIESYIDGDTSRPILNGALLIFEPGSSFILSALHEFATTYKPELWGWNGPELLTRVHLSCATSQQGHSRVQIEPPVAFYPVHWLDVPLFASRTQLERQYRLWDTIRQSSYAVHLWNRKTAEVAVSRQSLLHRILEMWVVLPRHSASLYK
eukprot:CAMPEP_0119304030 /NCGR_PEP_ID=MMETSP1333-20130426/5363_1 /TAXON_ID=418940 /ORGANISM="Scyphosphaera apsteinii, Strain RCC1455" /LENGTH=290 /DNA_ID=CAMNT_0007306839 /DNA_START=145 /DNA_END=1017 /DNA_ORIENTATION=-